jgi:hypothetical protein
MFWIEGRACMSKTCFEMQPLQNPPLCSSTAVTLPTRHTSPSFHLLIHTHSQNMIILSSSRQWPSQWSLSPVLSFFLFSTYMFDHFSSNFDKKNSRTISLTSRRSAQKLRYHWKICVSNWLYVSSVYKKVNTNELLLEHTLGVTPERTSFILINLKVISMFELTPIYFYWLVPYLHSTPVLISKPSG